MTVLLIMLLLILLIPVIYFGFWRAYFVLIYICTFPIVINCIQTSEEYFIFLFSLYMFICMLLTCRTFLIHGLRRNKELKNLAFSRFLWRINLSIFILLAILFAIYVSYEDVTTGSTHKIWDMIQLFAVGIAVAFILSGFLQWLIMTLINHYIVKEKYVETVNPKHLLANQVLRRNRYRYKTEPVELYASKSVFGVTYYYRKAKMTDTHKVYDNYFTRFFERYEAHFNHHETSPWWYKTLENLPIIGIVLFFCCFTLPGYIDGTPPVKEFINENIIARHYVKTAGEVLKCGEIEKRVVSGRYQRIYYTMSCDVKYQTILKTVEFERPSHDQLASLSEQIKNDGIIVHYNPNNIKSYYIVEEVEQSFLASFIFYLFSIGLIVGYSVYFKNRKKWRILNQEEKRKRMWWK